MLHFVTQCADLSSVFMGTLPTSSRLYSRGISTSPVTLSLQAAASTLGMPIAPYMTNLRPQNCPGGRSFRPRAGMESSLFLLSSSFLKTFPSIELSLALLS